MGNTQTYCIFTLAGQQFGVDIQSIESIVRAAAITPVPEGPEILSGLITIDEGLRPMIDLRGRFNLSPAPLSPSQRFIFLHTRVLLGFVADEVLGVAQYGPDQFQEAEVIYPGLEQYLIAGAEYQEQPLLLIDLAAFINEQELDFMADLIRETA